MKYIKEIDEHIQALQYGKPGPNDPRKTPAPKKDQKKINQIVQKTIRVKLLLMNLLQKGYNR